jgi:hypothetical protein
LEFFSTILIFKISASEPSIENMIWTARRKLCASRMCVCVDLFISAREKDLKRQKNESQTDFL